MLKLSGVLLCSRVDSNLMQNRLNPFELAMAARLQVPYLGEHYNDMLLIEAWIKDRSAASEAQSLLCSALMKREGARTAILERLAAKRGITVEELKNQILLGQASHLTSDEFVELQQQSSPASGTDAEVTSKQ